MTLKGIRLELYRAFHNFSYCFALAVGCLITIAHFVMQVLPKTTSIDVIINIDYPYSVFNSALMFDFGNFYQYLYYYGIVLISSLPYTISYFTDLRGGYIKNIYIRTDKSSYLIGKYLAVFLSAGSICVIPLILNMMLTMAVLPDLLPQRGTSTFALTGSCMFSKVFYTQPYLYFLIYLLIDFCIVGLFACLALAITKLIYNRYVALFSPFVIFFTLQTVMMYTHYNGAGPYYILNPSQPTWINLPTVLIEGILLFIIGFAGFYLGGGKKRDTL